MNHWEKYDKAIDWTQRQMWHVIFATVIFMIIYFISGQFFNNELWICGFLAISTLALYFFVMMGVFFIGGAYCLMKDGYNKLGKNNP